MPFSFKVPRQWSRAFGRGFGTEVRIDAAKADDPLRIFGHFIGHDLVGFRVIGVGCPQREGYGAVQAGFIEIADQVVAEKTRNAMPQRGLPSSQMRMRVDSVKFRVVYP